MLLVGFVVYFWATPKEGISANEAAAANVARMEAQVAGKSNSKSTASKPTEVDFLEKFKETRANQVKYLMIIVMITGVGFLGYSFFKKEEEEEV